MVTPWDARSRITSSTSPTSSGSNAEVGSSNSTTAGSRARVSTAVNDVRNNGPQLLDPAPADSRTSRTGTVWPVGAPRTFGSVVNEYCVLAMQIGRCP